MEDTRKWWYLLQESVFKINDDIIKNTWKCSLKNNKSVILIMGIPSFLLITTTKTHQFTTEAGSGLPTYWENGIKSEENTQGERWLSLSRKDKGEKRHPRHFIII